MPPKESDMSPAVILHLSDLHFGHPNRYGQEPYTAFADKLLCDIELLRKKEHIDTVPNILAITGDIANEGLEPQYEHAHSFLSDITKGLNIKREATLLVPGNHDINWDLCRAYFFERQAKGLPSEPPYFKKFEHYQTFFDDFYGGTGISFTEQLFVGYNLRQFGLLVIGLNSCEHERHDPDEHERHDPDKKDKKYHYGFISEKQVREAAKWCNDEAAKWCNDIDPPRKFLRIALLHHNLLSGSSHPEENLQNFEDIQSCFEYSEITFFLHGHRHQRVMKKVQELPGKPPLYILGAGAAGLDKNVIGDIPSGYQILRIDKRHVDVYLRCYAPNKSGSCGKGIFIADIDENEEWRYSFEIEQGTKAKAESISKSLKDPPAVTQYKERSQTFNEIWKLTINRRESLIDKAVEHVLKEYEFLKNPNGSHDREKIEKFKKSLHDYLNWIVKQSGIGMRLQSELLGRVECISEPDAYNRAFEFIKKQISSEAPSKIGSELIEFIEQIEKYRVENL